MQTIEARILPIVRPSGKSIAIQIHVMQFIASFALVALAVSLLLFGVFLLVKGISELLRQKARKQPEGDAPESRTYGRAA